MCLNRLNAFGAIINTFANPCAVNVGFSSFIVEQIRGGLQMASNCRPFKLKTKALPIELAG